jgi:hypothetical protein
MLYIVYKKKAFSSAKYCSFHEDEFIRIRLGLRFYETDNLVTALEAELHQKLPKNRMAVCMEAFVIS